jgi:hypothetical protein
MIPPCQSGFSPRNWLRRRRHLPQLHCIGFPDEIYREASSPWNSGLFWELNWKWSAPGHVGNKHDEDRVLAAFFKQE